MTEKSALARAVATVLLLAPLVHCGGGGCHGPLTMCGPGYHSPPGLAYPTECIRDGTPSESDGGGAGSGGRGFDAAPPCGWDCQCPYPDSLAAESVPRETSCVSDVVASYRLSCSGALDCPSVCCVADANGQFHAVPPPRGDHDGGDGDASSDAGDADDASEDAGPEADADASADAGAGTPAFRVTRAWACASCECLSPEATCQRVSANADGGP